MSRFCRSTLLVVLACLIGLFAIPARADDYPPGALPPAYHFSGALLMVGNNVCGGLSCTETVAFSFDLGYQFLPQYSSPDNLVYEAYFTNFEDSGAGALGSFDYPPEPGWFYPVNPSNFCTGDTSYVALGTTEGGEIDMHLCSSFAATPNLPPPSIGAVNLYSCRTVTCITDFDPPSPLRPTSPPAYAIPLGGVFEYSVTAVPEPSTIALLALGLLALGLGTIPRRAST